MRRACNVKLCWLKPGIFKFGTIAATTKQSKISLILLRAIWIHSTCIVNLNWSIEEYSDFCKEMVMIFSWFNQVWHFYQWNQIQPTSCQPGSTDGFRSWNQTQGYKEGVMILFRSGANKNQICKPIAFMVVLYAQTRSLERCCTKTCTGKLFAE